MSERMTNILGWIVFAAIMAGIWGLFGEGLGRSNIGRGDLLVRDFSEQKSEVTAIRISDENGDLLLKLSGETWVSNKSSVVNGDKINALLEGIALSKRREPKIGNTLRGARDGLDSENPITLQLMNAGGAVVFAATVGLYIPAIDGNSLTYVLVDGEDKAWLVSSLPPLSTDAQNWAE